MGIRAPQEAFLNSPGYKLAGGPLSFFFFDLLDRLLERRDKRLRVSQGVLGQLEFTHQHPVFVRQDQAIPLFHSNAPYWLIPMLGTREEPVKIGMGTGPLPPGSVPVCGPMQGRIAIRPSSQAGPQRLCCNTVNVAITCSLNWR